MRRVSGVLVVVLFMASCGGGPEPIDEEAFVDAAQVAVGGPQNLPLTSSSGELTEAGEAALEMGYLACEMSVDELHDHFFESFPFWAGPEDAPDQMHAAGQEHLCR